MAILNSAKVWMSVQLYVTMVPWNGVRIVFIFSLMKSSEELRRAPLLPHHRLLITWLPKMNKLNKTKQSHLDFRIATWGETRGVATLGGCQSIAAATCWGFRWAMRSVTPCAWALWGGAGWAWWGGGTWSRHHTNWVLWSVSAHSTENTFPIHPCVRNN